MKYYTYGMKTLEMNLYCLLIYVALFVVCYGVVGFPLPAFDVTLFYLFVVWMILHEIIHGISFAYAKETDPKNVVFGMLLEKGIMYTMCKQRVGKKTIDHALMAPLFWIGIVTGVIAIIFDFPILLMLSLLNIGGSAGDILMMIMMKKMPKDIEYLDLDDPASFTILCKEDLSEMKFSCLKLKDSGIYDETTMYAKDKKRIRISKASWIYFAVMTFFFLVMLYLETWI